MRWLLFHRLSDGTWRPMFGPLSEFPGCLLVCLPMLLGPAVVMLSILRESWRQDRRCRLALWWAAGAYPLLALYAARNSSPEGLPLEQVLRVVARVIVTGWVIFGAWRVVQVLGTCGKRRRAEGGR